MDFASQIKIKNEPLFESFQVTYNILETSTHEVLAGLINKGKTLIIKEALANGRVFKNDDYAHYEGLYNDLERLSIKYRAPIDAIALRFVIDYLQPGIVLSGASNTHQLAENIKALDFKLDNKELISLRQHAVDSNFYWNERKKLDWN